LLSGEGIDAIVEGEFEHLGQVEIAGEDVGFLAEGADLDAAAATAGAGVFEGLALSELFLNDGVGVEDGREPIAFADDAEGVFEEMIGAFAGELDVGAGLEEVHLVDDLEEQMGDRVGAVRAIAEQAAEVDVGEISVCAAFGGGDADLGRCRVVVELDEEALEQFPGFGLRERPIGEAALVEGKEMLIEMAGIERVPAVELGDHSKMTEPIGLQRLAKVARRVGGARVNSLGDLEQLGPALGAKFTGGELPRESGVAFGEENDGVAGDVERLERLLFVVGGDPSGNRGNPGQRRSGV
jgi:hypothetical protein